MFKDSYKVIGVMSGTSLDGIDMAYIHFNFTNSQWFFEIVDAVTVSYSEFWFKKLQNASLFSYNEINALDKIYTAHLGETISLFIKSHKIKDLDAVCSHGHTVLHNPNNGLTLQIGNLPEIKNYLNQKVVCNFRIEDVKLGGQGAPLVPIGDQLLFGKYDFCINLGGFSNVSFHKNNKRIAFDICAVNTVLNHYTQKIGFDYDMDGKIAITGTINLDLLKALNSLAFYHLKPPKSLGIENVNRTIIPLIDSFSDNIPIILATFCEHIAIQIKNVLPDERCLVLLSGGGTYNRFLIERLQKTAELVDFEIPSQKIIDFKEALIFGLLGVLRIRNEINVLSSVTGASKDHVAGYIF